MKQIAVGLAFIPAPTWLTLWRMGVVYPAPAFT